MKKLNKIAIFMFIALLCCCTSFIFVGCDNGQKLELTQSFKTQYYLNEELDTTNGIIQYTDENGEKTSVEVTNEMVSAFSTETLGTRKMIITYKDYTLEVSYTVNPFDVEVGAYYYAEDMGNFSNYNHAFIKFTSSTKVEFILTNETDIASVNNNNSLKSEGNMIKTYDEDGYIVYTASITDMENVKIYDITENAFTFQGKMQQDEYRTTTFTKVN